MSWMWIEQSPGQQFFSRIMGAWSNLCTHWTVGQLVKWFLTDRQLCPVSFNWREWLYRWTGSDWTSVLLWKSLDGMSSQARSDQWKANEKAFQWPGSKSCSRQVLDECYTVFTYDTKVAALGCHKPKACRCVYFNCTYSDQFGNPDRESMFLPTSIRPHADRLPREFMWSTVWLRGPMELLSALIHA